MSIVKLRDCAMNIETRMCLAIMPDALREAADKAEQFAFDLASLIDGKDDELADLLSPIKDFLAELAGIPSTKEADGAQTG